MSQSENMENLEINCCVCLEEIEQCSLNHNTWSCNHYNNICLKCYDKMIFNTSISTCPLCRSIINNIQNNSDNSSIPLIIESITNINSTIHYTSLRSSNSIRNPLIFPNILNEYTNSNVNYLNFNSSFNTLINLDNIILENIPTNLINLNLQNVNNEHINSNINNLSFESLLNTPINLENIILM
jgi:hypothetical protein